MKHLSHVILANIALGATATAAWAQTPACTPPSAEAVFGISAIECLQCTVHNSGGDRWVEYGAEPVVRGISRSAGILAGDVIVAVEGQLITTPAGGQRLSRPDMTNPTKFTVRRSGRVVGLTVAPSAECGGNLSYFKTDKLTYTFGRGSTRLSDDSTGRFKVAFDSAGQLYRRILADSFIRKLPVDRYSDLVASRGARTDSAVGKYLDGVPIRTRLDSSAFKRDSVTGKLQWQFGSSPKIVRVDTLHGLADRDSLRRILIPSYDAKTFVRPNNHGRLGFGIDCHDCAADTDASGRTTLRFNAFPVIAGVDKGSAAEAAGLLAGDVLRAIDEYDFTSLNGARRFNTLKAGQRVRFTVERKGKTMELVMVVPGVN